MVTEVRFKYPRARLLVFAREPVLGSVKTRLQGALGEAGCLALHEALLAHIRSSLVQSRLAPMTMWVSSNLSHECFLSHCNKKDIYLQKGEDLGQRMAHAAAVTLQQREVESVIIVGADCPVLDKKYLETALQALAAGNRVVLGPAEDGGYVLIGLRQAEHEVFRGIDWGSSRVLEQTRSRLESAAIPYALLETLWDVDRPSDLPRLRREFPHLLPSQAGIIKQ
jgi:uncharacterized protein